MVFVVGAARAVVKEVRRRESMSCMVVVVCGLWLYVLCYFWFFFW